jgi:uncharacterized caspase-like protein
MYRYALLFLYLILMLGCELCYPSPTRGKVYHLGIGLSYAGTDVRLLKGTLNDAREQQKAFSALYKERSFTSVMLLQEGLLLPDGSMGYDSAAKANLPTKERVLFSLASLGEGMNQEDLLVITYSGHGHTDGSWVLAPSHDEGKIFTDTGDLDAGVLLSAQELSALLEKAKGKVLLLIDSCYAGAFVPESETSLSLISETPDFLHKLYETYFSKQERTVPFFVMAATTRDNTSKEPHYGSPIHGYFTQALLEGLGWDEQQQLLVTRKEYLDLDKLYHFVCEHQKIPTEGENPVFYQHPTITGGAMSLVLDF